MDIEDAVRAVRALSAPGTSLHAVDPIDVRRPVPITITPVFVADLLAEDERLPVYVPVIDDPALETRAVSLAHARESWRPPAR